MSDYVLPACDSKALCAYLGLFRLVSYRACVDSSWKGVWYACLPGQSLRLP